eukprot:TRINITY_DN24785_c0_g1_i1.p1 TRINITY_DN24785_c0_g1~~TRINITY_DN24785_c0_g1_i1.p1  ORF type:complete len:155 (+),score=29.63 TRINITY_DN24785_c0_g1_i1:387-851(+)
MLSVDPPPPFRISFAEALERKTDVRRMYQWLDRYTYRERRSAFTPEQLAALERSQVTYFTAWVGTFGIYVAATLALVVKMKPRGRKFLPILPTVLGSAYFFPVVMGYVPLLGFSVPRINAFLASPSAAGEEARMAFLYGAAVERPKPVQAMHWF